MNINEPKGPGSQWTRLDAAQQAVERLEQQVAQLREENAQAKGYLERLFVANAPQCQPLDNLLGVCTQVDNLIQGLKGSYSKAIKQSAEFWKQRDALQTAHTTLRGLVENASYHIEQVEADLHTALNGTRHDPSWIRPIQLSRNERQELYFNCQKQLAAIRATLPREGGAQEPQCKMHSCDIPECVACGNPPDANPDGGEHE